MSQGIGMEMTKAQRYVEENYSKWKNSEHVYECALCDLGGMFASYAKMYYQDMNAEMLEHYSECHNVDCLNELLEELGVEYE